MAQDYMAPGRSDQNHYPFEDYGINRLRAYKEQLESIRDLLRGGMSLRSFTVENLTKLEGELRSIMRGLDEMRRRAAFIVNEFVNSVDAVQRALMEVNKGFYLAMDILEQQNINLDHRERLYNTLDKCSDSLAEALEQFKT